MKDDKVKEITPEEMKTWRGMVSNNEKERERLTKIAKKNQEELKQNFLDSKLKSTKLTVFLMIYSL